LAGAADRGNSAGVDDASYSLGGSQFLKVCHGRKEGPPPHVDLAHEIKIQNAVRSLIREGLVKSAHDCSEGGLAVALAECCFNPDGLLGAKVDCSRCVSGADAPHRDAATALFNESQSRIIISVSPEPESVEKTMSMLRKYGVPFQQLGRIGGDELRIRAGDENLCWPIVDLYDDWWNAIGRAVESDSGERIPTL
jgi:phosphoribosylformylglycinamidine synthase